MSLPLAGVKVLDLSRLLPGGFCTLLLADLGAEVLKVEDVGAGDYVRWSPPFYDGGEPSARSAHFIALNRNKRSIRIDLKNDEGREILLALVRGHDVVLESFRPGVLDRLGVGYETMRLENPGIVYCAISGYGQDGPMRDAAGHDMNYLALNGLLGLTGEAGHAGGAGQSGHAGATGQAGNAGQEGNAGQAGQSGQPGHAGGRPIQAAGQIADIGGGALMAVLGILAALRERDGGSTTGRGRSDGSGYGQFVDVSMTDGALSWLTLIAGRYFAEEVTPQRGGLELSGGLVCYRPYECADGWVALGALEPKFWQTWCNGVDRQDLIEKQFSRPGSDVAADVEAIFRGRTRAEWERFAAEHDCCLSPVLALDEALSSTLVQERGMVLELDQPGVERPVRQLGVPVKLSRTPGDPARLPAPALGEHTIEVLTQLGLDEQRIASLLEAGAVAGVSRER
ncbi:MAG: CaiB/BaiF CoA transferase family protein [Solirubrobacteraceae bacterium]